MPGRQNQITLAGKRYSISGGVQQVPIEEVSQQWRTGAPDYSDRQASQYWEWEDFSGGIGLENIDCKEPEDRRRLYSAPGVDTRWPGSIVLGPLIQSGGSFAINASLPQYGRFCDLPGALVFVSQATSWQATVWRNVATTWNQVFGATGSNVNLGRSWRFPVPNDTEQNAYLGTAGGMFRGDITGASWVYSGGTPSAIPARAIGYDLGQDTMLIQQTHNDGKLYSVSSFAELPYVSALGYIGGLVGDMVTFYDEDGGLCPYISVFKAPSGDKAGQPIAALYRVDLVDEKVYPVSDAPPAVSAPASGQTWRNIVVWQGWLYLALGHALYRYQPGHWEAVPPSSSKFTLVEMGALVISGLAAGRNWLYVNCCDTAAPYIFAISPDGAWHHIASDAYFPSGDICLSDTWNPSRLWWMRPGGSTAYIELPKGPDTPLETATYKYASTANLYLPWFDGRFADVEGTALAVTILADNLSATEVVSVAYRTARGAAFTAAGTITSTSASISFGSGVGVPFKIIQLRLTLLRGSDETKTPILRRIVFQYLKKSPVRYRYTVNIATPGTTSGLRSMETVLQEIEDAYNATTLREFKFGRVETKVNIVAYGSIQEPPANARGQRKVYQMQVVMEEPI